MEKNLIQPFRRRNSRPDFFPKNSISLETCWNCALYVDQRARLSNGLPLQVYGRRSWNLRQAGLWKPALHRQR